MCLQTYHVRILNLTDLESVTFLIGHEQPCDLSEPLLWLKFFSLKGIHECATQVGIFRKFYYFSDMVINIQLLS